MRFSLDLSLDVLRGSPATLRALLEGVAEPWSRGTEGPDTFSPFDVVGHLARVMAKQYREEVGPWVPYLPVLTDHEVPRS